MTSITIEEDGREIIVADIAPYRAELDRVIATLSSIYAEFENGPVGALVPREPEIVDLLNRYGFIQYVIQSFDQEGIREANILAGWEIVKQHRAGDG
ncbi:MAG: hypothetical protein V4459_00920 [Pseudomonadota bacterium]